MAAGSWVMHDNFIDQLASKLLDVDGTGDTIKMALFTTTTTSTDTTVLTYAGLAGEHANGNGYATGGVTLSGVTATQAAGVFTFDTGNASWTASGGSIAAKVAVIYDSTVDTIIAHCLLDAGAATVTATDGQTFTVTIHASGVLTVARA
jgi:hypothetical protein